MTATADNDSVDPSADQQTRRADELEDWLTDLRVNLDHDPPDWLTPAEGTAGPTLGSTAATPATRGHPVVDTRTPDRAASPNANLEGDPPGPAVGRHRAAE
jgi:hypothetical protein